MQQAITQDQFSFINHPISDYPTQITIFQQSAIFGQDTKELSTIPDINHTPPTPNQHLYNILEQFGSTLARYLALQMIGVQSYLKQSMEYLNHNIQDLKMLIFNAQVMFASKNKIQEFELAREEQCNQIQALIDGIEDDYCKEALSNLLGKIEEVRFSSQYMIDVKYKLFFIHLFLIRNKLISLDYSIFLASSQSSSYFYTFIQYIYIININDCFNLTILQKQHKLNCLKPKLFIFKLLIKIKA